MFGFFKGKKEKDKKQGENPATANLSDAKKQLLEQMRQTRAEIGEEELQKMAKAIKMENMKKQMRHDIATDDQKRERLLDEIRDGLRKD